MNLYYDIQTGSQPAALTKSSWAWLNDCQLATYLWNIQVKPRCAGVPICWKSTEYRALKTLNKHVFPSSFGFQAKKCCTFLSKWLYSHCTSNCGDSSIRRENRLVASVLLVTASKQVKSLNSNQYYQGSQNIVVNWRKTRISTEWGRERKKGKRKRIELTSISVGIWL